MEKNLKKIYDKKFATNLDDGYKCITAEELINELIGSDEETTFDSAKDKSMKPTEKTPKTTNNQLMKCLPLKSGRHFEIKRSYFLFKVYIKAKFKELL